MNNIDNLIRDITKEISFTGSILTLDKLEKPEIIPFGIDSLDEILGIGGIPRGRITEVSGNFGSTKSSLTLKLISEAQKLGIKSAFIDAEMTMNRELAEICGVDTKNLLVGIPASGEESFELIESLSKKGYGLVVVDSVSALIPESEEEADFYQQTIGLQARLMSKAMRKIIGTIARNNTALVMVNQLRETVAKMPGMRTTTTSGGRALKFYSTIRLETARVAWLADKEKNKTGMRIKIHVEKNKLSIPQKSTEINFLFDLGFDTDTDHLESLMKRGIISLIGRTYHHQDNKIGDKGEAIKYIKQHNL